MMHAGQVDLGPDDVRAIFADRYPDLADRTVRRVPSSGTVTALFRIGDDVVARFPLLPATGPARRAEVLGEMTHARDVADHVALPVPRPIVLGAPHERYAGWWSLWRWLPGEVSSPSTAGDLGAFARDLASFVRSYRAMPGAVAWDGGHRGGGPLADKDEWVRFSIDRGAHLVDATTVRAVWDACLRAEPYVGPPVLVHADLVPANLLVRNGRLTAVIDLGTRRGGDPAADLTPAWHLFDRDSRRIWRAELGPDDATWTRGRGWALEQAIGALHYYEHTNPGMTAAARHTLRALLDDAHH